MLLLVFWPSACQKVKFVFSALVQWLEDRWRTEGVEGRGEETNERQEAQMKFGRVSVNRSRACV